MVARRVQSGGIGFTGTQEGMTPIQYMIVRSLLLIPAFMTKVGPSVHHGDCVGSDEQFHEIARSLRFWIVGHPPSDDKKRAFCEFDYVWDPRPYLDRNKDIVLDSTVLIACPNTPKEKLRSGTWATVREAERQGVPVIVVCPDGTIVER